MHVLVVKILEGREAGPVFPVEHLVHILLSLAVDAYQDQRVEGVAEVRKAHRVEEVVHIGWVAVEGLPQGSS